MSANLREQDLYRLFREKLPSWTVPAELQLLLQRRLLAEVAQTLVPSDDAHKAAIKTSSDLLLARLRNLVRHLQSFLPLAILGLGVIGLLIGALSLFNGTPPGELTGRRIRDNFEIAEVPIPPIVLNTFTLTSINLPVAMSGPSKTLSSTDAPEPADRPKPTNGPETVVSQMKSPSKTEAAISLPLSLFRWAHIIIK